MRRYEYTILLEDGSKITLTTSARTKSEATSRYSGDTAVMMDDGHIVLGKVIKSSFRWVE